MTKKQLTEKWEQERSKAAGEASKLNVKLLGLGEKVRRLKADAGKAAAARAAYIHTKGELLQVAARVVTIDQFLNDI